MKKIQYIAPSIKVANIKLQNILVGSDPDVAIDPSQKKDVMESKGGYNDFDDEDF